MSNLTNSLRICISRNRSKAVNVAEKHMLLRSTSFIIISEPCDRLFQSGWWHFTTNSRATNILLSREGPGVQQSAYNFNQARRTLRSTIYGGMSCRAITSAHFANYHR